MHAGWFGFNGMLTGWKTIRQTSEATDSVSGRPFGKLTKKGALVTGELEATLGVSNQSMLTMNTMYQRKVGNFEFIPAFYIVGTNSGRC